MKLTITTTATNPYGRQDWYDEALACYGALADEVVETGANWPEEFEWTEIGRQFQQGYDYASGDWVIRADFDYFFHENDFTRIRDTLMRSGNMPALSFWKYQFHLVDRYCIKSRPVIALNKKGFGDRIKLNGGGDLCQPTLDGQLLSPDTVAEMRVPVYNYDFSSKSEKVIRQDFARFARARQRTFGNYEWGGPDEESALAFFKQMTTGRFRGRGWEQIKLRDHPKFVQENIASLSKDRFGYEMFGWVGEKANYY